MPSKTSEASPKAGSGVLLPGDERPVFDSTSSALRHHFLTSKRGVAPNLAKIIGDCFFGEEAN